MGENSESEVENGNQKRISLETSVNGKTSPVIVKDSMKQRDSNGTTTGNIGTDIILPDSVLEKLYHSYTIKQRRPGLIWFLVSSILFNLWAIVIPQGHCWIAIGIFGINIILNAIILILLYFSNDSKLWQILWGKAPHAVWFLAIFQFIIYLFLKPIVTPRDILGWAILLIFLIYVTLPVPLVCTGILFGGGFFAIYLIAISAVANRDPYFMEQINANGILILASGIIGLLYYFLGEAKQKRAFLEAKKSLEVKMVIEEQSAEQERLLLSVLPEHVAVKMRQDLGSTNSEQFKKIYMSRHENVSILYADIVGFTAISSTYSAQDLVKMLNELFARFDRLADKYQQLRIKILGDCYYCISGAPVERPDHAVLCVHMGLSMVKAIKYVQQKTNSPVDMRVGIHTGAILAGILGQRQWQFDVYSKDVELANKMESSGKAGRVHISEKTFGFLNGEFEVEPAYGEKREEALRIAGLKTYFITKVLVPFVAPDKQKNSNNGTASSPATISDSDENNSDKNVISGGGGGGIGGKMRKKSSDATRSDIEVDATEIIPDEESKANSDDNKTKEEDFQLRLRKELVSRDGHGDLSKDTTIFLSFKNDELEKAYSAHREPYSSVPLLAALLVQIIDVLYSSIILSRDCLHLIIITAPLLLIALLVWISVAESFPQYFSSVCVTFSKKFNDIGVLRRLAAVLIILLMGFSNLLDMFTFAFLIPEKNCNISTTSNVVINTIIKHPMIKSFNDTVEIVTTIPTTTTGNHLIANNLILSASSSLSSSSPVSSAVATAEYNEPSPCAILYPSYLSNFSVLILIAIAVIAQLTHFSKIILMLAFTLLHCIANIFILQNEYQYEDFLQFFIGLPVRFTTSTILFVAAASLSLLARHMDKEDRVIFKWKSEVAEQKEKVSDMRRRNEALVYNVLPVHVAEHFMKNRKRSHDDLYSQSYAAVGVLFASMPNFTDFYSEETVNNQGLECLRFLNEVISDYDALLQLPQFQDIAKIKTIGSTYMAASGLNPSKQLKPDDPICVRWKHLEILVEFALELKKALTGINEQSFNHFVLKMGINHGPITAGVIGARKPHYDIWGNTVNVASRMESTGKAGAIQVTEETTQILQTFGYTFEQRGLVSVKGKGELMTYYLQGKEVKPNQSVSVPENGNVGSRTIEIENSKVNSPKQNKQEETTMSVEQDPQQNSNKSRKNSERNILNLNINEQQQINTFPPPECDPRSPKNLTSPTTNLPISSPKLNNFNAVDVEDADDAAKFQYENNFRQTTTVNGDRDDHQQDVKQNGIENTELDLDLADVKTPLLNLNSTNLENREFNSNNSEKDSLIAKD